MTEVGARKILWLLMVALSLLLAWAWLGRLDVVSMAVGEVIPSSQVKNVQHLEGGIVEEILVREGDDVQRDQPIIVLQATASMADVLELEERLDGLTVTMARLKAESTDSERIVFHDQITQKRSDLVQQAEALFETRRSQHQSNLGAQKGLVEQRRQEMRQIRTRMRHARETLDLLKEQVAISDALLQDNLTNRYNHLTLLKEASQIEGALGEDEDALRRAQAALSEAERELDRRRHAFRAEVRYELKETRRHHSELSQRMKKLKDNLQRTTLRSSVEGIVKTLHVATIGGVIQPGMVVAEIVPREDRLIVEARLPPQDVGYVAVGQPAQIRLASGDADRLGRIEGYVMEISPDTLVPDPAEQRGAGSAYYRVRVELSQNYFERGELRYQLVPGIGVTVSILTGMRSVLDILLDPFSDSLRDALRER